jgi:hypothetical protein
MRSNFYSTLPTRGYPVKFQKKPVTAQFPMWVTVLVLLVCVACVCAHLSLQFSIKSRFHASSYQGLAYLDDKSGLHALLSLTNEGVEYEYHSSMGLYAFMYTHEGSDCHRVSVPIPSALWNVLYEPMAILSQRKTVTANHVFDSKVASCLRNNTIEYVSLDDGTNAVLCDGDEIPKRIIGERFEMNLEITQDQRQHLEKLFLDYARCNVVHHTQSTKSDLQQIKKPQDALWFVDHKQSCRFDPIRHQKTCDLFQTQAIEPTKTCVFLHGVGQTLQEKGPPVDQFPDYWGSVHTYTPQCRERIFIREETKGRGWNSLELQKSYCAVALYGSRNSTVQDSIIRDTILFVHSMGNLVLSAAIKNGFCEIDTNTTSWYQIMGPFGGTKVVPMLEDICRAAGTGEWPVTKAKLYRYVADVGGYCVPNTNHAYPAYWTMKPSFCNNVTQECVDDLYSIAHTRIKGSMCGNSAYGVNSRYSPVLKVLSMLVGYGEDNDGMVPYDSSCMRSSNGTTFGTSFKDNYYLSAINHSDGTCRNGDSYFSGSASPCSYYCDKV